MTRDMTRSTRAPTLLSMGEVLLVTVQGGDPSVLVEEARELLARVAATTGSVHVRATGRDADTVAAFATEHEADAMFTVRGAAPDLVLTRLTLPAGARLVGAYRANEIVKADYQRSWADGDPSPGVTLLCFVRRKPDITPEAYSDHWRDNHGPLALRRQPGFWRYVQNHVIEYLTTETPDFDGIGELHFRTAQSVLDDMFDSPEGQQEIMDDTFRFMSHEGSTTLPSIEWLAAQPRD
jgi:uncharacterized protein (TIGR02118 family)